MKLLKCKKCGKLCIILNDVDTKTVCCNEEMEVLNAKINDGATEKHLPVCNLEGNQLTVKVGEISHPMTKEHYIGFILVETENGYLYKELSTTPTQTFLVDFKVVNVYAYCNLHGLWKTSL